MSPRYRVIAVAMLAYGLPLVGLAAESAGFAEAWQQPVTLKLPTPTRTMLLKATQDAAPFAAAAGLSRFRTHQLGADLLVEAPLSDSRWQALQSAHCDGQGAVQCVPTACRSIAQIDAQSPARPAVRIAGDVAGEPLNDAELIEVAGDQCRAAIPAVDRPATSSGTTGSLNLNLDLRAPRGSSLRGAQDLEPLDRVTLTSELPDGDTSQQSLQLALGCESSETPLDSLKPAQLPDRVVAVVDRGAVAGLASRYQLTPVMERPLSAGKETLAVFVKRNAKPAAMALLRATLLADSSVRSAQPEYVYRTAGSVAPADPLAGLTYAPVQLGARVLHQQLLGVGQRIALIDTGVDTAHPDLAGRVVQTVDTTGTGYGSEGHGTAVAGIIAAGLDNHVGGYGVAPEATLLSIKACVPRSAGSFSARCRTSTLVQALDIAISESVPLINMSLTGPPDPLVARYVRLASEGGALVIAAAGNGGVNARPAFPAALPEVLAVTALDASERLYADANLGGYIDLAAPGVDLVTTAPGGAQPSVSGTSFAAAAVSGVAALLREHRPDATAQELVAAMSGAVRDLGPAGQDEQFGRGLLSACGAAALDCDGAAP